MSSSRMHGPHDVKMVVAWGISLVAIAFIVGLTVSVRSWHNHLNQTEVLKANQSVELVREQIQLEQEKTKRLELELEATKRKIWERPMEEPRVESE